MEITKTLKVMLSGYALLLVVSSLVCLTSASICTQGRQYLSTSLAACVNCTKCPKDLVVIRPCEIHRDTQCGTLGELLKVVQQPAAPAANPHRHKHRGRHHKKVEQQQTEIQWLYGDDVGRHEEELEPTPEQEITSTEAPFSSAETLVWDWQAIALSSAVFACILFFLAMTLYSLHQAKQWRRLKDNFEADVEDLSARLSLMAAASTSSSASSAEKGEVVDARIGPISDGNYLNNRCVYLEQLLNVRKDTKIGPENGGNVYIEESSSTSPSATINGKT